MPYGDRTEPKECNSFEESCSVFPSNYSEAVSEATLLIFRHVVYCGARHFDNALVLTYVEVRGFRRLRLEYHEIGAWAPRGFTPILDLRDDGTLQVIFDPASCRVLVVLANNR